MRSTSARSGRWAGWRRVSASRRGSRSPSIRSCAPATRSTKRPIARCCASANVDASSPGRIHWGRSARALLNQSAPEVGASVVVPTYNERDRLEELIERIFDAWQSSAEPGLTGGLEVIVVDDNSPDGTGECADAIARRRSVRVVHRAGKLGLGTAVVAGFEVARGRVVAVMDADLSHPPQLLPRLIGVLRETHADFVVASRY